MQRSYLVKSSVNFADFGFFVKQGDILVHDTANGNKLTVFRNGAALRSVQQTALGLAAMVKNEVIVEVIPVRQTPTAAPKAPAKPIPAKKEASAVNWGGVDMSSKPKPSPVEPKEPNPLPKPKATREDSKPAIVEEKKPVKTSAPKPEIEDETI